MGINLVFHTSPIRLFRPYGESLDSLRPSFGSACGSYSAALRFSLLAQKVTKEKTRPAFGFRYAKLPSLQHCFEGHHGGPSLPRRPQPSFLVWHPCQTSLSTAPHYSLRSPYGCYSASLRFGLLTRFGDRVAWSGCAGKSKEKSRALSLIHI